MKVEFAPIILLLFMQGASIHAYGTDVSIETQVTWVSAWRPEVQVLIRNQAQKPIEFLLQPDIQKIKCPDQRWNPWRDLSDARGFRPPVEYTSVSLGLLPSAGWAHRIFLLDGGDMAIGCSVDLVVLDPRSGRQLGKATIVIPAPNLAEANAADSVEGSAVTIEQSVESDFIRDARMIRILVHNKSKLLVRFGIRDQQIKCERGSSAHWNWFVRDPPQPFSHGPIPVAPGSWAVFLEPIALDNGAIAEPSKCTAEFELVTIGNDAAIHKITKHTASLREDGFIGIPGMLKIK